jgi:hypothetical protein
MLCHYGKSLEKYFGRVGEGVHSYRVFNIAIIDVLSTIIGAFIIHLFVPYKFIHILIVLFILGIILHHLFCVPTTIDRLLFG